MNDLLKRANKLYKVINNFKYCQGFNYSMVCNFCGKTHEGHDFVPPCIRSDDENKPLKCPKCDKKFKNIDGLMKHHPHA